MKPKLLASLIMGLFSASTWAIQPFVVKDIRVEGIQRTEAGTVFSYLPVKVGETMDDEKASAAIKALFSTGFFKDVRLEYDKDVLIVMVQERPAISKIEITGTKEFPKEQLKDGLKQVGLAESRIFDKALLDKAEQELKRQYYSRGKYAATVTTTVTPLERNRVAIDFTVNEGEIAKIHQINIVGNQAFKEKELLDLFVLTTPGWLTWYSKNDQYSKQKLSADLETLRSFYLNQGYLEFNIDSTQVSISPDKKDIYLTVNITEGEKYTVSDVKLAGDLLVPEEELKKLIKLKAGDVFSREKLTESSKLIGDRLGNDGYAFANVNAVPELDKVNHKVAFTFFLDPGRRVYVHELNITGNTKTSDEVIRREMRQLEGGWYSAEKINRSRERLNRLGYFSDVNVETPAVTGTTDQVDVNFNVTEKPTGSIMAGLGFSSTDGVVLSGSVSQSNVFGSGNYLAVQVNSSKINKVYSLSFTNPYYTPDGVSLGYDVYQRNVDATTSSVSPYTSKTLGGGMRLGIPLNELDTVNFGLSYERTKLGVLDTSPIQYINFVNEFGSTNTTLRGDVGWARDTRDSLIYPTQGTLQRVYGELGLPGGTLKYYKLNYQHQWFYPLSRDYTLMLNGEAGMGNGYGGKTLPFFKNFYAGGNTSVRGYDSGTLGPKDINGNSLGGNRRIVGNAEVFFPFPGLNKDKSVRLSAFMDAGAAYGQDEKLSFGNMRYSAGVGLSWQSPIGPLKFSLAKAFKAQENDKIQKFQFVLGTAF
ncbi:outer membrane protein assembly factor BamA [Sulfurirhabdus autotrophica]|uniref:Outer membrane protein assembly factor BamA n=1 Tax=Sulfurirhabdus autotrophica TaxID=1706046 RepID=A0A4R3YGV7_9PROT|nr:outer membrane protein assembly factor BamA [Sulfurirhabdus autotrophica]TCV90184.1 Beta-barrel assembly machine subunit BamA [Sulfurirhabdus autotrophica]